MRRLTTVRVMVCVLWTWLALSLVGCAAQKHMGPEMAPSAPPSQPAMDTASPAPLEAMAAAPGAPAAEAVRAAPSASPKPSTSPSTTPQAKSGGAKDDAAPVESGARPMLIYEAQVGLMVEESRLPDTIEKIIDAAETKGGYLVSRGDQAVSVRVPSQQLRAVMAELAPLGQVVRRSVTAQDVSDQFHDLEVRLRSLEAVRDRLQQFLSRASNMSEAMTIAAQLDQVAQQIDQVKGQMQLLRTRSAYSLLQVTLQAKPRAVVVTPQEEPKPPEARPSRLPVEWLGKVGLDSLTTLGSD